MKLICGVCGKELKHSRQGYLAHLRTHKQLPLEERNRLVTDAFPGVARLLRYRELKGRQRRGEQLTGEDQAFVAEIDKINNQKGWNDHI